jgi:hypothetical protein
MDFFLLISKRLLILLIDHEILILKLRMFGCSPLVLKWFTSYLSDRINALISKTHYPICVLLR